MKKLLMVGIALYFCVLGSSLLQAERLKFPTQDGVVLSAVWHPPRNEKITLILLHGVGSVKEEWDPFADFLRNNGYGVFYYDLRGHGQSTRRNNGEQIMFETFYDRGPNSEWSKMVQDLGDAVKFLYLNKSINPERMIVMGASIGANIALQYAAQDSAILAAILLSPGLDYQGVRSQNAILPYGSRPLFIAAAPQDGYAYQTMQQLKISSEGLGDRGPLITNYVETENPGHGVQMFKRRQAGLESPLESAILKWVAAQ